MAVTAIKLFLTIIVSYKQALLPAIVIRFRLKIPGQRVRGDFLFKQ